MDKKASIIIIAAIFLVAALVAVFNENKIENVEKENKKTTTTKNITTTKKKEEENIMDKVTVNYHASIRIEEKDKIIYFDPFKIEGNIGDADYIFITHSHYDHYSESDIKKVMKESTKFVVTSDLESKVIALGVSKDNVMVVYPNESHTIDGIKFDVVPAYNTNKSYHKKSYNWVGYNLDLDGTKYYVVGDSDVTDELKKVKCDVIFVPVGGTYTMTDSEAASIVNEMKPKYAVPIHYDEAGSKANAENFVNLLNKDIKGEMLR